MARLFSKRSRAVQIKLTEEQFWKRYFQSKLFNAHRASIRSSATQHVVKDDPIFDKYLDKEDDGNYLHSSHLSFPQPELSAIVELEPRRQRNEQVDAFVNLVATMEDHENVCPRYLLFRYESQVFQTGNEKDITMQAGRQKAALPLIRKFNEHSERLLNSAL